MQREYQRTGGEAGTPAFGAAGTPHLTTHRVGPDEGAAGRIRCGLCHATWNSGYEPVSACPGVRNYGWWDNVPDYLKTKTALGKKGLKASGRAKGCVPRRRKDEYYYLFDAAAARPAGADRGNPWECAMTYHAAYVGEFYEDRGEDYRYQPLRGGDHSAVGDARATLALVRRMAEGH